VDALAVGVVIGEVAGEEGVGRYGTLESTPYLTHTCSSTRIAFPPMALAMSTSE
jgi:hypothetical protein